MNIEDLNWNKMTDLIPAIVQENKTQQVLMLGYMNREALEKTLQTQQITFYSRSKKRLWTKGETSGNGLELVDIFMDCDQDALLITANAQGPTCHKETVSCFNNQAASKTNPLYRLEERIQQRQQEMPDNSYTAELFTAGVKRIAQKVGEEGVEVAIAAVDNDLEQLTDESADLLFHLLVLLRSQGLSLNAVIDKLTQRMRD